METPLRLAVDFDGVCHDPNNRIKGYKLGLPIEDAMLSLRKLKEQGCLIIIHSVWADTDQKRQAISEWCHYFRIPYDFITNQKPVADLYIDNNGYRFENWLDTMKFIENLHDSTGE